jgi:hypothetical protein
VCVLLQLEPTLSTFNRIAGSSHFFLVIEIQCLMLVRLTFDRRRKRYRNKEAGYVPKRCNHGRYRELRHEKEKALLSFHTEYRCKRFFTVY